MATTSVHKADPLIRKLENLVQLSDKAWQALERLPIQMAVFPANQDVARQGDKPNRCCVVIDGFCCNY